MPSTLGPKIVIMGAGCVERLPLLVDQANLLRVTLKGRRIDLRDSTETEVWIHQLHGMWSYLCYFMQKADIPADLREACWYRRHLESEQNTLFSAESEISFDLPTSF